MGIFFLLWGANFAILGVVVIALCYAYVSMGTSLDVKEWYRETGTALLASLAFTLAANGVFIFRVDNPRPEVVVGLLGLGLFMIWIIYRLGHIFEMNELETVLVPLGFAAVYLPAALVVLRLLRS